MIISIRDNWQDAKAEHNAYLQTRIDKFQAGTIANITSKHMKPFITQVAKQLLSDKLDDLDASIEELLVYKRYISADAYQTFLDELKLVFNYTWFSDKKKPGWNAYALCKHSKARICTYCHHHYALTVHKDKKTGAFRPTLDHYYPRALFPHLSLTLANLIPCCSSCNSSLKGDADFYTQKHLHPLFHDENIEFRCTHTHKNIVTIIGKFEKLKKELTVETRAKADCPLTQNSIATFAIDERYAMLAPEAMNFISAQIYLEALLDNQRLISLRPKHHAKPLNIPTSLLRVRLMQFERKQYKDALLGRLYADLHDQFHRGLKTVRR